jgi:phage terminase large subunit-like protein
VQQGETQIGFKSYDQGREKWQGPTLLLVWFDEEPPADIYSEGVTRTSVGLGPVMLTFTPLQGMTDVVRRYLIEKPQGTHVTQMTIEDAEHYSVDERQAVIASYPAHEREARAKGVAEGHAAQQRKIFKKNGEPVGEVGIDRESSPGVGQWYMKHYASGKDLAGYDSYEEAVAELKHCMKQGVAEGDPNADPYYVYDYKNLNKRPLKFKTREGAKAYAEKHGLEYCSAGFYHDKVKTKQAEPVRKIEEPQGYDDRIERPSYGMNEVQTDYSKRRQRERDVDAGKPVTRQPKNPQTDYAKKRAKEKRDLELGEAPVTKKPQPYNDPDWHKSLSPEQLRKLTGPKHTLASQRKKPVKENYWTRLQNERNTKVAGLVNELTESVKDIK